MTRSTRHSRRQADVGSASDEPRSVHLRSVRRKAHALACEQRFACHNDTMTRVTRHMSHAICHVPHHTPINRHHQQTMSSQRTPCRLRPPQRHSEVSKVPKSSLETLPLPSWERIAFRWAAHGDLRSASNSCSEKIGQGMSDVSHRNLNRDVEPWCNCHTRDQDQPEGPLDIPDGKPPLQSLAPPRHSIEHAERVERGK